MIIAKSPTGSEIVGVLERVPGCAEIEFTNLNGEFEYGGNTDMFWEEQRPYEDDRTIFLDDEGTERYLEELEFSEE